MALLTAAACSPTGNPPADSNTNASETPTEAGSDTTEVEAQAEQELQSEVEGTEDTAVEGTSINVDAVLAADANCVSPLTQEPLVIGYAADTSANGSLGDAPSTDVAVHMAKLINCSGGLNGRPIEVLVADVSGDELLGPRAATKTLLEQGATVLLGPRSPDQAFRVVEATTGRVPVLFPGSTATALGDADRMSFLVGFNDRQGASAAAKFAKAQGWSRAVTFSGAGSYFSSNPEVFANVFPTVGGTILADFDYVPFEQVDFSDAVAEMVATPPDVVYSAMVADQWVALRRQMDAAGLTGVQLLATDAFEATDGYALSPDNEGIFHVTHLDPGPGTRVEALSNSLAAAQPPVRSAPTSVAAQTADAIIVIANAFLASDTTEPMSLGRAIASVGRVDAVTADLAYEQSGVPSKSLFVHQVVDGRATLATVIEG